MQDFVHQPLDPWGQDPEGPRSKVQGGRVLRDPRRHCVLFGLGCRVPKDSNIP